MKTKATGIMELFLIRHAHAVDAEDDDARPLSARGRDQVKTLAGFLSRSGLFAPAEIWHSSLLRSRQTAELLARRLRLEVPLKAIPGLEPEGDVRATAKFIAAAREPLAIVGHEPHLSTLATLLLAGRFTPSMVLMKKASALALEGAGNYWAVRWHVSPALLV